MINANIKLILFDLDGTLAARDSDQLYPDAERWFIEGKGPLPVIVTNQGGIGLRYWMESEKFGDPSKYPTLQAFEARLEKLFAYPRLYKPQTLMCARYQSKKTGQYNPVPAVGCALAMWREDWRKPAPGMLLHAMVLTNRRTDETLMVGDAAEDQEAAQRAGCAFQWAWQFFGREQPTGERGDS